MMRQLARNHAAGVALVEIVMAIVIVGFCVTSVLALLSSIASHSADAMTRTESTSIATAYLAEILSKEFADSGVDGEVSRSSFDDVDDYLNLPDTIPRNQFGTALGLNQYSVQVAVQAVQLGTVPNDVAARLVTVTVTNSTTGRVTRLSGYRTAHANQVFVQ
jgi:Tfp pilus assembly protein PilV